MKLLLIFQYSIFPLFQHSILPKRFRYCLYLFTLCVVVSLISCETTSIVPIQVYDPTEVKFPDKTRHITLVNRLYNITGNESFYNSKKNKSDLLLINNIAHQKLFEGIEDVLYSLELIDTVTIVQKTREDKNSINFNIELVPMNWDTIEAISDRNNSDVLISLDGLIIKSSSSTKILLNIGEDFNAFDLIMGNLNVYITALFRMYDTEKKHLIEKYYYSDTIFWESTGITRVAALRNLPSKEDAISEATYWSGFY